MSHWIWTTETSPILTSLSRKIRIGSAGLPITGVNIRIAEDGEVQAIGPNIMQGYFGKPDWTRSYDRRWMVLYRRYWVFGP